MLMKLKKRSACDSSGIGRTVKKTPQPVLDEVKKNLNINLPGYTPSNGIPELRNAISKFYKQKGFNISNDNIFVTVGSSGAFLLTFIVLLDPGDTVLLFKPCYPAYRNILHSLNLNVIEIDFDEIEQIKKYKNIDGLIVSSPNNPTGKFSHMMKLNFYTNFA